MGTANALFEKFWHTEDCGDRTQMEIAFHAGYNAANEPQPATAEGEGCTFRDIEQRQCNRAKDHKGPHDVYPPDAQPTTPHTATGDSLPVLPVTYRVVTGRFKMIDANEVQFATADSGLAAALIESRINAFEGLVAALDGLRDYVDRECEATYRNGKLLSQAQKALKLAGRGSDGN